MDARRQTILIVDDSQTTLELLLHALETDYEVLSACDGPTALELASSQLPDLILLDVVMPGLNGFQVCAELKADPRTRSIPVIFVTAMDGEGDEERGLSVGAIDFLTKPFKLPVVRARVRNHLELKRVDREREKLIRELQDALANVRTLSGLLPICAWCKKIRDDKGYWTQVEVYVRQHTQATFSHGICPECDHRLQAKTDKPE